MTATAQWREALQEWALPEQVLASAPESPWGFPVDVFAGVARRALTDPLTPTHLQARDALPAGGVLLDVGSGAGAASVPIVASAGRLVAIDEDERMLDELGLLVREVGPGVEVELVRGRWPDVSARVGVADVVVCANVAYNVAELGPFVLALTSVARHRVVLELSAEHPQTPLSPLWQRFWDLQRPTRPTAEDAAAVVREVTGRAPTSQRWARARSFMGEDTPETVAWIRRRLCLPPERDDEVADAVAELPVLGPATMVTLSWPA